MAHLPNSNDTISVTRVQSRPISTPCQRDTVRGLSLLRTLWEVWLELIHNSLRLQIPNLDDTLSGSAQPVTVGTEAQGVDDVPSIQRVETLALCQIPEHGGAVLASRGAEGTIWGDGDGVDVAGVSDQVGA